MKSSVLFVVIALAFAVAANSQTNPTAAGDCYQQASGSVGAAQGCEGMLVVTRDMLLGNDENWTRTFDDSKKDFYLVSASDLNSVRYYFGQVDGEAQVFVGQVDDMRGLFRSSRKGDVNSRFNGRIENWDTSSVINMSDMFSSADGFNREIGRWNVSKVRHMARMFLFNDRFNQSLNDWDVSSLNSANSMFAFARAFNGDISNWNVSKVWNMQEMFSHASKFNRDLSGWNVSRGNNFAFMFRNAYAFRADLSCWDVRAVKRASRHEKFAAGVALPDANKPKWGQPPPEDCINPTSSSEEQALSGSGTQNSEKQSEDIKQSNEVEKQNSAESGSENGSNSPTVEEFSCSPDITDSNFALVLMNSGSCGT